MSQLHLKATAAAADLSTKWRLGDRVFGYSQSLLLSLRLGKLGALESFYVSVERAAAGISWCRLETSWQRLGGVPSCLGSALKLREVAWADLGPPYKQEPFLYYDEEQFDCPLGAFLAFLKAS